MRILATAAALILAAAAAAATAGPGQRADQILILGRLSGGETVVNAGANAARAEYSFNDRGRGDHIVASWTLDAAGVPIEYAGSGNDYMKAPVTKSCMLPMAGVWRNRSEHGGKALAGEMFYVPNNAPPEFLGVLARALLRAPGHRLALLPAGDAWVESAGSVRVPLADGGTRELTRSRIMGLDFSPTAIWLDRDGNTAGVTNGWFAVLPAGYAAAIATLTDAQASADSAWSLELAEHNTHAPAGDLVIRNARLFDPRDLSVTPGMSVLVRGAHIVRVAPDAEMTAPGAEVIDAAGRFLMPGLWDNHQHFGGSDGALDLANGVTSARDMANDTDRFLERVTLDAGSELGPRVFKAGIIDGTGPLAGPTKMLVDSAPEAIKDVDWYADHGYGQIVLASGQTAAGGVDRG